MGTALLSVRRSQLLALMLQTTFQNPLAAPSILEWFGASMGVAIVMLLRSEGRLPSAGALQYASVIPLVQ